VIHLKRFSAFLVLPFMVGTLLCANKYDSMSDKDLRDMFSKADFNSRITMLISPDGKASKKLQAVSIDPTMWKDYTQQTSYKINIWPADKVSFFSVSAASALYKGKSAGTIKPGSDQATAWAKVVQGAKIPGDVMCDLTGPASELKGDGPKTHYHYTSYAQLFTTILPAAYKLGINFTILNLTTTNVSEQSLRVISGDPKLTTAPIMSIIQDPKFKSINNLIMHGMSFLPYDPSDTRGDMKAFVNIVGPILGKNSSLVSFDVSNTNITSDNALVLTAELGKNKTLKTFNLSGNTIDKSTQDKIKKAYPHINFIF